MYWKIDLRYVSDGKIACGCPSKFVDTEAKVMKTIDNIYKEYKGLIDRGNCQINITTLEETSTCTSNDYIAGIKRDVTITDLIEGNTGADIKTMILDRLHLSKALVQLRPYVYRNPTPTSNELLIEIRDKMISEIDFVKMSDIKEKKAFMNKWKSDLLALCQDSDWYDTLLDITGWRTFAYEGPTGKEYTMSRLGYRIFFAGGEIKGFNDALDRRKKKK
jgi:hypothetical protein